jgi:Concanavalin A-like lectin/glucanases superfamily/Glycosyl hydrolase family 26
MKSARRLSAILVLAFSVALAAASAASANPTGVVAAYSFNQGTGTTARDDSHHGNEGWIEGAKFATGGKFGDAMKFAGGENECVTVPSDPALELRNGFTLEAWVKPEGGDESEPVFFKENEGGNFFTYMLFPGLPNEGLYPLGATAYEAFSDNKVEGTTRLPQSTWSFLAMTYSKSTEKIHLYVNGKQVDEETAWGVIGGDEPLRIGCVPNWEEGFTGLIDNVRIYEKALTAKEIGEDESTAITAFTPTMYWGSWTQNAVGEAPFDMGVQEEFESHVGRKAATINWSTPFEASFCGGTGACKFQTEEFENTRTHGSIPFFSWGPNFLSWKGTKRPPDDQEIAEGAEDSYIKEWAKAAKAWGHPFFLRFAWEMNGGWFRWGVGTFEENGETFTNTAANYVAMWKHVHQIFKEVGATNATWVWCPNIDPGGTLASMSALYPGNEYVDWTCLDGYNWDEPWTSFNSLFSSSYSSITGTIATSKPMIIGETASTETGGSKKEWIEAMFSSLAGGYPKVHGLQWFDVINEGPGDWPIESSAGATSAFAVGIQGGSFASAGYRWLETSQIPATP